VFAWTPSDAIRSFSQLRSRLALKGVLPPSEPERLEDYTGMLVEFPPGSNR
jgi:hypothetical protein